MSGDFQKKLTELFKADKKMAMLQVDIFIKTLVILFTIPLAIMLVLGCLGIHIFYMESFALLLLWRCLDPIKVGKSNQDVNEEYCCNYLRKLNELLNSKLIIIAITILLAMFI